jgi:hypothetical protein
MRIALHVFQAAAPPVRKSRRHAQKWKNIPVDRILGRVDMRRHCGDAIIITLVSHFSEETGSSAHSRINKFVTSRASRKMSRGRS